jgi:hypothetical protein
MVFFLSISISLNISMIPLAMQVAIVCFKRWRSGSIKPWVSASCCLMGGYFLAWVAIYFDTYGWING